jgi:hypothetical protein
LEKIKMDKIKKSLELFKDYFMTKTKEEITKELEQIEDGLDCGPKAKEYLEYLNENRSLEIIVHLINGGECIHKEHKYKVIFKAGVFRIKETGTVIGNFNNLIIL